MAYLNYANNSGKLGNMKVKLLVRDDGYHPGPAISNTIEFVEKENIFLLFNYVGTPTVTRVLPLLKMYAPSRLLLLFPFTGAEPQRHPPYQKYVFNLRASYRQETAGLVHNFVRVGRRRIAVFFQADAYGRSGWDGVRRALKQHGLKIVAEASYHRGDQFGYDFQKQVQILRDAKPDVIISVGAYAACAGFIRDARRAGWQVPIANLSFADSDNLLKLLNDASIGQEDNLTGNLVFSQVVPSYEETSLPAVVQYREMMDKLRLKAPPGLSIGDYQPLRYSFVSMEGFLNAKLLVEALVLAGDRLEIENLPKVLENLHKYNLGIGVPVSFGPNRHQGLDQVYYTTVKQGRQVPMRKWDIWRK